MPEYLVDVTDTFKIRADNAEEAWDCIASGDYRDEDITETNIGEPELVVKNVHDALTKSLQEVWDTATFWGKRWGYQGRDRIQRDDFHWGKFCAECQKMDDEYVESGRSAGRPWRSRPLWAF